MYEGQIFKNVHDVQNVCLEKYLYILVFIASFTCFFQLKIMWNNPKTYIKMFGGSTSGYDFTQDLQGALEEDPFSLVGYFQTVTNDGHKECTIGQMTDRQPWSSIGPARYSACKKRRLRPKQRTPSKGRSLDYNPSFVGRRWCLQKFQKIFQGLGCLLNSFQVLVNHGLIFFDLLGILRGSYSKI